MSDLSHLPTAGEMVLFDRTSKPYHEGWTGLRMHVPTDAFASAGVPRAQSVRPFTAEDKALFDRTSKPYDE